MSPEKSLQTYRMIHAAREKDDQVLLNCLLHDMFHNAEENSRPVVYDVPVNWLKPLPSC